MKKIRKICESGKGYNKTGWRRIASPAGMKLSVGLALRSFLLRVKCFQAFFHTGIVDTQKLVLRSSHVDKIRLALSAFLIEKPVDRFVRGRLFQVSTDNLVQSLPQMR